MLESASLFKQYFIVFNKVYIKYFLVFNTVLERSGAVVMYIQRYGLY